VRFSARKVLRHEFHGLLVIAAGACVLDLVQESIRSGRLSVDPVWLWACVVSAVVFVLMSAVKKATHLLEIPDPAPAAPQHEP
jgi:hypothetical protein